ncbi:unnamed protein product [Amoebophrya sp. A120]|nr:unnamed protein product [Amoebophrya sp. A120]|eukprot:GSA120T00009164001.1
MIADASMKSDSIIIFVPSWSCTSRSPSGLSTNIITSNIPRARTGRTHYNRCDSFFDKAKSTTGNDPLSITKVVTTRLSVSRRFELQNNFHFASCLYDAMPVVPFVTRTQNSK